MKVVAALGVTASQCTKWIDGPKINGRTVAWRRQCRNYTRHPSKRCHLHRTNDQKENR